MPLLTKLTRLQIDNLVKEHYDLGSVNTVWKVKTGWTNTLFKLNTTHGDFFLKVYEEINRMQIMAEHEVVNSLVKSKFPTASILRTKSREGFVVYEEKFVTLFTAIDGRPLAINPFKSVLGDRIASMLNLLHKTKVEDFIYLNKLDLAELIDESLSWYLDDHRVERFRDNIIFLYEQFSKVSFFNLTKGLVHNDLGIDNFLVEGNNIRALIDFDQVVYGSIVNDLAKLFARSVNLNIYEVSEFSNDAIRFVRSYSKGIPLSKEDINALLPLILFQKVLILIKVKKNIREGSLRAHTYHFEEYLKLVENEVEILFKNYQVLENNFSQLLD